MKQLHKLIFLRLFILALFISGLHNFSRKTLRMDGSGLDEKSFRKLEYYSLVSKVCTELNNHLGLEDKVLGMF